MRKIIFKFPITIHFDVIKPDNSYTSNYLDKEDDNIINQLKNHLINKDISLNYIIKNVLYGLKIKNINILPNIVFDIKLKYIGYIQIELIENLNQVELIDLTNYLEWEFSDGFGEGFEQEPFYIEIINRNDILRIEYFAHFWNSENWFIKTEE